MKYLYIGITVAAIFLLGIVLAQRTSPQFGGLSTIASTQCTVSSVAAAPVGNQSSVTILAANSRRAWAMVEQPLNATNTVSVAFNAGTAATLTSGLPLQNASTTNGTTFLTFGLNTDFPYTGAVTGITNTGSSTVNVTVCNY